MSPLGITLLVLTGLGVFLYAIDLLSQALRGIASDRMERWLKRYTAHVLSATAVGVVATTLLDSSSVVIILVIVLVNTGKLALRSALAVVLGANIGTTFGSQIIAFDIGAWSAVPLLLGIGLAHLGRTPTAKGIGNVLTGFGLLFTGLFIMGTAVEPLRESTLLIGLLHGLEDPLKGSLTGGLITLVLQSSSATVAMAIALAGKGLLSLPAGIAVMLGAELGTCSDTLLAAARCGRRARKVGLFHLLFNLLTIILGLLLIHPFTDFVVWFSGAADDARRIANAHMMFNVVGVLLCLPFLRRTERLLDHWLPEKAHAHARSVARGMAA
ncbi:MAG: Na/Pi cotransporter family protein [Flavobacteriales bacterium]|nr:MAG: Na/Pi cotransporter family protein [Flavobacteriales bacterium]